MSGRLVSAISVPLLLAATAFSGWSMFGAASDLPWVRYAAAIEQSRSLPPLAPGQRDLLLARIGAGPDAACEADVPQSKVTVAIFVLRKAVDDNAPAAERAQRLADAERITTSALRCRPADGNLWYVLALLRELSQSEPQQVLAPLLASAQAAPMDGGVLLKRGKLFSALFARDQGIRPAEAVADIERALTDLKPGESGAVYGQLRLADGALAATLLDRLRPERRAAVLAAAENAPRDIFKPAPGRPVEIDPFGKTRILPDP